MGGYPDLEGGKPRRSIFLAAKTFETHLRNYTTLSHLVVQGGNMSGPAALPASVGAVLAI